MARLDFPNVYKSVFSYSRYSLCYTHILPSFFFFFKRSYVFHKKLLRVAQKTVMLYQQKQYFTQKLICTPELFKSQKIFCSNKKN